MHSLGQIVYILKAISVNQIISSYMGCTHDLKSHYMGYTLHRYFEHIKPIISIVLQKLTPFTSGIHYSILTLAKYEVKIFTQGVGHQ